jgi:magnesium chelatase family protein
VARTIADMTGAQSVGRIHVAEALSYRRMAARA